jgi:hypothetical protein
MGFASALVAGLGIGQASATADAVDATSVARVASPAPLEDLRTIATDAAAFVREHAREDTACEKHLVDLKAQVDRLFAPHAIALRRVEMALVDPDRLAQAPGFVAGALRDFKFLCMLGEGRYEPLRDIAWIGMHRANVEGLLRHLPLMTEAELLVAEPLTNFDSSSFTERLRGLEQWQQSRIAT